MTNIPSRRTYVWNGSSMLTAPVLSAADAIPILQADRSLTPAQRAKCVGALRSAVRLCRPEVGQKCRDSRILTLAARLVPMDCAYLNETLFSGSPAKFGLTEDHFRNLLTLLRKVLRLLGRHAPRLPKSEDLSPPWGPLHAALSLDRQKGTIGFFGYCDVHGIPPEAVTLATLLEWEAWSTACTLHRSPGDRATRCASNWNWARDHVPGWPPLELVRPSMRDEYTVPLDEYCALFQQDSAAYLDRLACLDEDEIFPDEVSEPGYKTYRRRFEPLSDRTIDTRAYQIRQSGAALIQSGVPLAEITSLRDLVQPWERVRTILNFHRRRAQFRQLAKEGEPAADDAALSAVLRERRDLRKLRTSNLGGIGELLRQIARYHCKVPEPDLSLITELTRGVKPDQQTSMTEKNTLRLNILLEPQVYGRILRHPETLMRWADPEERAKRGWPPMKVRERALLALYGAALEILIFCPLRRENLAGLRLDRHLQRTRSTGLIGHIHLDREEVKNRTSINWPVPQESAKLIEVYLREHRPHLTEPGNPYLFPNGEQGGRKGHDLGIGLIKRVHKDLGVKFNLHIMRHLAVVRFLSIHPGKYDIVRHVLGHKRVTTTIAFYSGPEMEAAIRLFTEVLRADRRNPELMASALLGRGPAKRGGR